MHIIPLKHGAIVCGESLAHYGTPRHSGRYSWGSGENPYHHGQSVPRLNVRKTREEIKSLKKQEKLHKRAGRRDWHEGKFSSRKLHRQEAANAREQREKLQKLLDEHIPMDRTEKLAKGKKIFEKTARMRLYYDKDPGTNFTEADLKAAEKRIRDTSKMINSRYGEPQDLTTAQLKSKLKSMKKEHEQYYMTKDPGPNSPKDRASYNKAYADLEKKYEQELKRRKKKR